MKRRKPPKTSKAKIEKRKKPVKEMFEVKLEDLIQVQRDRWNSGYLRDGTEAWQVALHLFDEDDETRWLFRELDLDEADPFHWRVLLELFAKTYVNDSGAPSKISKEQGRLEFIKLAGAMTTIMRDNFGGKWRSTLVARVLKTDAPYKKIYGGEDQESLRKRVERTAKQIGPMDDEAMGRAWDIYLTPHSRNPFIETIEELDEKYCPSDEGESSQ
jgi:hypothetical protein